MDKRVYLTRDTYSSYIKVWPATVGIRKFHGCVEYGSAHCSNSTTGYLDGGKYVKIISQLVCKRRYGFCPKKGEAWYISQTGRRYKEELAFSD